MRERKTILIRQTLLHLTRFLFGLDVRLEPVLFLFLVSDLTCIIYARSDIYNLCTLSIVCIIYMLLNIYKIKHMLETRLQAMAEGRKSLNIKTETWERLQSFGKFRESTDELLNRLMDNMASKEAKKK
jgi:hypothetical protein